MRINEEFSKRLYELLRILYVCIVRRRSDGFVVVRCPFCGDSVKSKNKGHLYIKVIIGEDEVPWYKCQRCGTGGWVDEYLLSLLGLYDDELEFLRKSNLTHISKQYGKTGFKDTHRQPIKILPPLNNIYTKTKIRYINNRLGISLTQKDIDKFKLVFNLKDFLNYNKIKIFAKHHNMIDSLDEQYVGFLSAKNEFINFRIIDDNAIDKYNKRYDTYNILDTHENTRRFITVKNRIDIMHDIEIITCEGPFDLMGIYKHVYNEDSDNRIFVSNMGMSAESVMMYFIKSGVIFNKLKIYADKGVTLDYYRDLKKKLNYRYKGKNIEVFYNDKKGEKDFGVCSDDIKLKSFII